MNNPPPDGAGEGVEAKGLAMPWELGGGVPVVGVVPKANPPPLPGRPEFGTAGEAGCDEPPPNANGLLGVFVGALKLNAREAALGVPGADPALEEGAANAPEPGAPKPNCEVVTGGAEAGPAPPPNENGALVD